MVLILLFLLVVAVVYWQWQQRPLGVAATQATGQVDHGSVYGGEPRPMDPAIQVQVLRNTGYVSGYSNLRRDPLWVGYRLFRIPPGGAALPRPREFVPDSRTLARVVSHDFTASGFERGHLAPNHAIAQHYGAEAQRETFLLTNITPQRHELNVGVWEALEQLEDDVYAQRYEQIWVLDGPLFDADPPRLHGEVQVPRAFYKILVREEAAGRPRFLAFIFPQPGPEGQRGGSDHSVAREVPPRRFLTSVREVERASRLDFFWQLEKPIEEAAESSTPTDTW